MNNFLKCTKWVMVLFSVSLLLASANQDFDDVLVKVTTDNRGHVHVYGPNFHCFTPPMSQKIDLYNHDLSLLDLKLYSGKGQFFQTHPIERFMKIRKQNAAQFLTE